MLERFKLVLTIDDFGSASSRVADELESALGWTNTTIDPSHSNTHHYEDVLVQSETGMTRCSCCTNERDGLGIVRAGEMAGIRS